MAWSVKKSRQPRPTDPIGVFDSGVGGLSTLRYLRRLMPHERFIFLADQAYVPYGEKSAHQLKLRCARIARFLQDHRVKMIVVACNTATCYAIDDLRAKFSVPFVGTVPAIKTACTRSKLGSVAVCSTPATAKSPMLRRLIRQTAGNCRVLRIACAGLEEAVERGSMDDERTRSLISEYMKQARRAGADQLVLGCTHYPFLKPLFRRAYAIPAIDSAPAIARHAKNVLRASRLLHRTGRSSVTYFTTGDARKFSRVATMLLGRRITARAVSL